MPDIQAASAAAFTASIGVNTHIDFISSSYQNYAQMENAIAYLGVSNVRDTYDDLNDAQEYAQMAGDLGVKFDFYLALGSAGVPWQIAQIEADPGIVKYAEGYNESDNWWQTYGGQTGIGATRAAQETLYADIHADPQLAGAGVVQASFAQLSTFSTYGDMSAYADYANSHSYFGTGNNPDGGDWANYLISLAESVTPGKPALTTEAGWFTMPGAADGVDQTVQAKYELNLLMEQFQAGVSLTYLYGLVDNFADSGNTNSEDHFGLFNADWTPKPAAIAVHNLMAIMADPGIPGFTPGTLGFSLAGMSTSCRDLLTEKSDGTFVLTLWNDVRLSGPTTQTEIPVAPVPVTLTLDHPYASITIYDPLTGTTAIQDYANTGTIQIAVPDHPVIVEISSTAHSVPSGPVIAAPENLVTTPGTAVHVPGLATGTGFAGTLTVRLSSAGGLFAVQNLGGHVLASGTHSLILTGAQADINTELATLTYTGGTTTGTDSVALSVRDSAGHSATRTIPVRIVPPDTAVVSGGPLLSGPASFTLAVGSTAAFPDLSLSDPYAAVTPGTMTLSVTSTQGILQAQPGNAAITGAGTASLGLTGTYAQITASLATLTYTAGSAIGPASVTLSATDQGARTSSQTIAINAIAAPLLAGPASLQAQAGQAAPVPGVSLADDYAMANANQVSATITAAHGTLALLDGTGRPLPGSGTGRITVSGSVAVVAAELATLTYTASQAGQADTIRVRAADLYGGSTILPIAVSAVAGTPPSITAPASLQVSTQTGIWLPDFSVSDAVARTASVSLKSTLGTLSASAPASASGTVITGSGTGALSIAGPVAAVNAALGSLRYMAGGTAGPGSLVVSLSDDRGGAATRPVAVDVVAKPVLAVPGPLLLKSGTAQTVPGIAITDPYAALHGSTLSVHVQDIWGALCVPAGTGAVSSGLATHQLTLSGTLAQLNASLAGLSITAGTSTGAEQLGLAVSDPFGGATAASIPVTIAGPAINLPGGSVVHPGALAAITGITVSDPYAATRTDRLVVNISNIQSNIQAKGGRLAITGTDGKVLTGTGPYALQLSGTTAQVDAALATLTYQAGTGQGVDGIAINVWDPLGMSSTATLPVAIGGAVAAVTGAAGVQQVSGFTAGGALVLDLRQALAQTGWNGETGTISRYLQIRPTPAGTMIVLQPNGTAATARDIALLQGANVSLASVQLGSWLAPNAATEPGGITMTDTGSATATLAGGAAAVKAALGLAAYQSTQSVAASPVPGEITLTGWNGVLDAGPGMNFLNGLTPGDNFRLGATGQGIDTISGFSTGNGDHLDLTRTLAGLNVAADFSNLASFVTASSANGCTTLSLGTGGSSQVFAVLENVTTNIADLISHHNLLI